MARIILIETSTALCSVALAEDGRIVAYKESETPRAQASLTAPFVKDILDAQGIGVRDCDAVCVSKGPGSYTGLRVGVSTAKGLCFGAGIPLIAIGTLDTLVYQAADLSSGIASLSSDTAGELPSSGFRYVIPMVDARRMEVYTAVFTPEGRQLTDTRPQVVEPGNYSELLAEGPVLFIGDGAGKCREALSHPNAYFAQCCPKASAMLRPAFAAWDARRFEDTAYFEPFYLKEFIATVPRKKLF
ncbi:MAG: tRNA (adenosine(37)-N6)-threonylcarbamoyltransferase complex dimerization subunit type 1 TsaB [Bacteroidales bacterium]|nr:tRNA (adenosine(37)-N6)-threonylcarbamoyltransferase complex dimerization subunit type 1 TsaB [Bacteroidales bacterium]